jgi:hypothetical protein
MPMLSRGDMRAKYHLTGNVCTDCLCACYCMPCDLMQQDKEAKFHEPSALMEQPRGQEGMVYEAQQRDPAFHHG